MNHNPTRRRITAAGAALLASPLWVAPRGARAEIKSGDNPDGSAIWQKVRASFFENRPIVNVGDDVLVLDAPGRAEDAAVVPIAMRSRLPQTAANHVTKLTLVIDNNPSPISAIFAFTPHSGRADIETRVRVDEYSFVRAIAETSDGRLLMRARFVKASGGCSAPPGKDPQAALASLGKIRLRVDGDVVLNQATLAQLMISHPNDSGLAMDQVTRTYATPHFVRKVDVRYAGKPIMSADIDFSISENPNFRFYFTPGDGGALEATVVDNHDLQFNTALKLDSGRATAATAAR